MAFVDIPIRVDGVDSNSAADINQLMENILLIMNPVGKVSAFAGASAPTGWLICDGSAVSRTTYSALFTVISTTYGVGDNSTTFNLPDVRETVPVGVGTRGSGVTAHDTYTLGQFKDDQTQGKIYYTPSGFTSGDTAAYGKGSSTVSNLGTFGSIVSDRYPGKTSASITDGTNGTPREGTTTHGKQIGMNYIIKY